MKKTKPTLRDLFVCIDRLLARGYRYGLLIGATREGTRMVRGDPEELLLVAEMISIGNSRHVHICWSINSPSEPMDWLFCSHHTRGEDATPPPAVNFGPCDDWGQSSNPSVHSDESDSEGHQPKWFTPAAKRLTRLSSKKTGSSMRKTRQRVRNSLMDVD